MVANPQGAPKLVTVRSALDELGRRVRHQAVVADLGQRALQELELQKLVEEAIELVAKTLDTEHGSVFEHLPDRNELLLRAGVGYDDAEIGAARVSASETTHLGFALASSAPVVVEDLFNDPRFASPPLFRELRLVSGLSAVILGRAGPYGVLCAHSTRQRRFTDDDVHFLQSVANVLAYAIDRRHVEAELEAVNKTLEERVERRTGFVKLLENVAVIANKANSVERALKASLERICGSMGWSIGHAYLAADRDTKELVDGELWYSAASERYDEIVAARGTWTFGPGVGMIGRVLESARPEWMNDVMNHPGFVRTEMAKSLGIQTALALPVLIGKQVVAVLEFFSTRKIKKDKVALDVLAQIGTQLGRVVERRWLQEDLIDATWEQQRNFGQELHDNLCQELAGAAMLAKSLQRALEEKGVPEAERAEDLLRNLQAIQSKTRAIAKGLFPVQVEANGLMVALEELAANTMPRYGVTCDFECNTPVSITDNNTAMHLFRIAQEAVNNAVVHGKGKNVVVALDMRGSRLSLKVRDDGVGIQADHSHSEGMGLRIMRYRADVIGGALDIRSLDEGGTLVSCTLRMPEHST